MQVRSFSSSIKCQPIKEEGQRKRQSFGCGGQKIFSKIASEFEFKGINMPFLVLALVTTGAVILPRLINARDKTERSEIIQRDVPTSLIMLLGFSSFSGLFSSLCSKCSGFALVNRAHKNGNVFQKTIDYFRPVHGNSVMNSTQLTSRYSEISKCKHGIVDFANFINENGGDIKKVLEYDADSKNITKSLFDLWNGKSDKTFETATKDDIYKMLKEQKESSNDNIKMNVNKLEALFDKIDNSFVKHAKFLNSIFGALTIFLLVPTILGFALPKLNELSTKKMLENNEELKQELRQSQQNV